MVQDTGASDWWKFSPDATGNYSDGTWTQLASTPNTYSPEYYASAVLANGKVVVIGGEYNQNASAFTNLGFVYDPVANTWTALSAPSGWTKIGDAQCAVLPNGTFMLANPLSNQTALLDPSSLTWTTTGTGKADDNDEEGWTLLQDGTIFTLDVGNQPGGERYLPSNGTWIATAPSLNTLIDVKNGEIGPQVLLPNGKVFVAGATGNTGIFTPPTTLTGLGSWTVGPTFPLSGGQQLDIADGPGVVLPNGNVLCTASPGYANPGAKFFEFDGTNLNPVPGTANAATDSSFVYTFLLLPNGQIFSTDQAQDAELYTPAGSPQNSWRPTISGVTSTVNQGETYSISGTQFNGLTQGSFYGDDNSNYTNYPLVRITNTATGNVVYCRTHGHSTMGIATGTTATSTDFDVPMTIGTGASTIQVVTNGIASAATSITVSNGTDSISSVSLNPSSVVGGAGSTGTVTLKTAAPAGGWMVNLSCQRPTYVGVPSSITIPAGSTTGTFAITTKPFTYTYTNVVTATDTNSHSTATLTAMGDFVSTVTLNPSSVLGGAGSTGTITLNVPAPTGGWVVNLACQRPGYVGIPSSVTIPAGSTTGTFAITTKIFGYTYTNTITATDASSTTVTTTLTVLGDSIASISLSPSTVVGGSGSTGTITLNAPAPAGGWVVNLACQRPTYVGAPTSITIPAGSTKGTFAITTKTFGYNYTNVFTATDAASSSVSATLSINVSG